MISSHRFLVGTSAAFVVAGCSLVVDTSGLTSGATAAPDASTTDAAADGRTDGASGTDGATGDGGPCTPPGDPDLVGYYPLDETSGTIAKDCSGRGHNGTVISAPPTGAWGSGHRGGAFLGDGTHGCIDLGNANDFMVEGGGFSVAAWVYVERFTTAVSDARYIIGRSRNVGNGGWRLAADLNAVWAWSYVVSGTRVDLESPTGNPVKTWTHVVGTYDTQKASLWVDGEVKMEKTTSATIAADTSSLRIGCRGDDNNYLDGRIDDVRVYRRVLTATEIKALAK